MPSQPHPAARRRLAARDDDPDRRRRRLSQNNLLPSGATRFLRKADIDPGILCLEIGAGEGILTAPLAGRCRELVAYELDPALAQRLRGRLADTPNARVITGDFLTSRPPREPFQVAGNVPFSVTSSVVDWCLSARAMTSATLITQLEYARKRTGAYGRWSLLTISTWPRMRWELRGSIARAQFRPVPQVDAGILQLSRRPEPLIAPSRLGYYERMVATGFRGVGGSLLASLRREYPADRLGEAFRAARIDRGTVVAFVRPGQWVELFLALDRPN